VIMLFDLRRCLMVVDPLTWGMLPTFWSAGGTSSRLIDSKSEYD
jgi:hypothetical protein